MKNKTSFDKAINFVNNYCKSRNNKSLGFFRLSIKNGHPFIYFTPFFEKSESVTIHFFNNGKIQLTLYSAIEYFHENIILDEFFDYSFENIIKIIESKIYPPVPHWVDFLFNCEYNDNQLKFNQKIKKDIIGYFANDILFKKNIDAIFIDRANCDRVHFKNYYTQDFGVIYFNKNKVKLFKKEYNSELKYIYSFSIDSVSSNEVIMESFLDKKIKELKIKIYKYF